MKSSSLITGPPHLAEMQRLETIAKSTKAQNGNKMQFFNKEESASIFSFLRQIFRHLDPVPLRNPAQFSKEREKQNTTKGRKEEGNCFQRHRRQAERRGREPTQFRQLI